MEAISDLPVVTVLWADILQVASLNAVEFTNGQTPGSTMSTEAFAHDYPYGLLERLKSPEIAFISAVDGSPLLSRQERPYGTT